MPASGDAFCEMEGVPDGALERLRTQHQAYAKQYNMEMTLSEREARMDEKKDISDKLAECMPEGPTLDELHEALNIAKAATARGNARRAKKEEERVEKEEKEKMRARARAQAAWGRGSHSKEDSYA